jgi:hypothetical protein
MLHVEATGIDEEESHELIKIALSKFDINSTRLVCLEVSAIGSRLYEFWWELLVSFRNGIKDGSAIATTLCVMDFTTEESQLGSRRE